MQKIAYLIVLIFVFYACNSNENISFSLGTNNFNDNWEFTKDTQVVVNQAMFQKQSGQEWELVSLPHTANLEPLVINGDQWQGDCYYRKFFSIPAELEGHHIGLRFEGSMQVAHIYLNGQLIRTNLGGYLPFYVNITDNVKAGRKNCVVVKLNNEDNAQVPPGKPIRNLDFNYYSGIYRNVSLVVKDPLHISDMTEVDKVAGGGIFVTYPEVNKEFATVKVDVDLINDSHRIREAQVQLVLKSNDEIMKELKSVPQIIKEHGSKEVSIDFQVENPKLWSPLSPGLYSLEVNLIEDGEIIDTRKEKIGIRTFTFSSKEGFSINGDPMKLRGTNRHQEYPYIGYALSDNAHYRDAWKIKKAGFNFVRLSHYPQSSSFMRACDELGLLVMDAIPGWQFFGDSVFQENAIQDVRKMVRRSRNHPCVILWEASLNETRMTQKFMQRAHAAVHEEYPGPDVYTCGWMDEVYDLFIPARQHSKPPHYWNNYSKDKPLFISEYGDWEYYAHNAGFNQKAFEDLSDAERNSRQLRGYGQKRLAQQALNYQESHNSNLAGNAVGDANWLMFDYNRGYAQDLEASGIMDIFRLPKFAYYFYQSQANIGESISTDFAQPMVYIANYYNDPSFKDVKVYSNCDEVELLLNGQSLGKQKPDDDKNSVFLNHPPFTFHLADFVPGELMAVGYLNGKAVVEELRRTPKQEVAIKLWLDESGKSLEGGCNDVVFAYAAITDKHGTIMPDATNKIMFMVEGEAELIGDNPMEAEAGIATILLKAGSVADTIKLTAESPGLKSGVLIVESY